MRPQRQELADRAAHAVAAVLGTPPGAPRSAHSLFDLPGFDSIAVVAVLERLETDLGVEVPADLIVPEAFDSLDSLTDLLATTVAGANREAVR
ncbi:acyl carrier protein [Lentzea sp. NPDC004782]|uniref:acyl carrier protein n=1 Tax=Lentzea sp. NPDC004782 TaxID=3154458 RepID=UPI0033AFF21A